MQIANIPQELKDNAKWCLWRYESSSKRDKPTKVPYNPNNPTQRAKSNDIETFAPFNVAVAAYERGGFDGVGIYVGGGISAIDIDHCFDENGVLSETAIQIMNLLPCYFEVSPSGTGLRGVFKTSTSFYYDDRLYYINNAKLGVEIYISDNTNKYLTITGETLNAGEVCDCTKEIEAVAGQFMVRPRQELQQKQKKAFKAEWTATDLTKQISKSKNGARFEALMRGDWSGYTSQSQADLALCNELAFWTGRDAGQIDAIFRQSRLMRDKWDKKHFGNGMTYGEMTIYKACRDCKNVHNIYSRKNVSKTSENVSKTKETPDFFDGNRFLHHVMGDYLMEQGACKINEQVHVYKDGVYQGGADAVHGALIKLIPFLGKSKRTEVYEYLRVCQDTPIREIAPPNLIPFKTKIYDIKRDTFIDYSRDYVFLNRFPYDYNPKAERSELIENTISEIADHDTDTLKLLFETFGNCFYRTNEYRGMVLLYGERGSNGKSTLLNVVTQMVGRENCSFLSMQDTADKFRLAEIYGKLANIGDDIPDKYLEDSSIIKKITSGNKLTAERKGQDPFWFEPATKMFFSMNTTPRIKDQTEAFLSRMLLIPMNHDFSQTKDTSLMCRVWTQQDMEYLYKLAMDGLRRLIDQSEFTRPACVLEALKQFKRENDPVAEFLEWYDGDVIGEVIDKLFMDYKYYAMSRGYKLLSQPMFTRSVNRICGTERKQARQNGKRIRFFSKVSPK